MTFQNAYQQWLDRQVAEPLSEGQQHRLAEGHGHAERMFLQQIWYPAFRHFDGLHAEYEIADFKDGSRYLDFAFVREPIKLAIEIDGYDTHLGKANRWQFSDNLMRQNHLVIDGWHILRFSYDDITSRPRMCEQLLQQYMGCWLGSGRGML
ncbi:hypothetical protein [Paenibacillus silvisoli]|uniref:hypothetical protein n=1 Tax=Paenibacillus silvisoli TaxID=3110539 RepID=UPI002805A30B|nr:hypothetical protein [Paenibacillus silvisoli]